MTAVATRLEGPAVALGCFVGVERRVAEPSIDLRLFLKPAFVVSAAGGRLLHGVPARFTIGAGCC